jgi:hypothetical protein
MDTSHLEPTTDSNEPDPGTAARTSLVCSTCGTTPRADDVPMALMTWSRGTDRGRTVWTCPACSREHVRSIEGKLDPLWW